MATVRFQAGDVDLVLTGTEAFVTRQLLLLSPFLGDVDYEVLRQPGAQAPTRDASAESATPQVEVVTEEDESASEIRPENGRPVPPGVGQAGAPTVRTLDPVEEADGLREFYAENRPKGRDTQTDAALLIAYYLQRFEGRETLRMGDLVHSCIRAGVDTRNLNRPLGILTRRGLLESVTGNTYRISSQGVQTVESRL